MSRRAVIKAMRKLGCVVLRDTGGHTVYACPCGRHTAAVPRHRQVSAGVVMSIGEQMRCLGERWLQ
ncbi:type II toxin-antitoxin system HicA family toxin [Kutzneria sp. 744]|uniref:type II toxin-antitoxin system HicA family toxin n=1 Tax=Kutzneria sp. (strain 744) TaxID=345341 RepID=UPI000A05C638